MPTKSQCDPPQYPAATVTLFDSHHRMIQHRHVCMSMFAIEWKATLVQATDDIHQYGTKNGDDVGPDDVFLPLLFPEHARFIGIRTVSIAPISP
ncbi:hypothetical protein BAQU_0541 [Bifidobacterium aquikefiri]|uniref:Uncharacterized protein n=2 Tax=Bifidobacterium aquikefiri TaxID=1653207 RepID=A0A261GA90_9BIFI|nr:hypothetical protein BAQU_0541 [Bifidobacterium aquikefiri]